MKSCKLSGATLLGVVAIAWSGIGLADPSDANRAALDYVNKNLATLGLADSDVAEITIASSVPSKQSGVTHVYLQQRYRGIEVWNGILNVSVSKDGRVISAGNRFIANIATAAGDQDARQSAIDATEAALDRLSLSATETLEVMDREHSADQAVTLSDGGVAARPIAAKLVWMAADEGVRLAWSVEVESQSGSIWCIEFIDAQTGDSLGFENLMSRDSTSSIASAIARPESVALAQAIAFPVTDGAAYRVFPQPLESPTDGDRELVQNAADPAASPFGWHDTNGMAGAEFTVTRGNNVHAYADRDNNNQPDPGSDPDGGPNLLFDFPLDLNSAPVNSMPAIVTNLFYWNNVVHDITHNYGFDEASGNFQVNNYGNGGNGNDDVRAEAQDGSGRNNANFGTSADGFRPRMQMFEWRSALPNPITVLPPSAIAGTYFGVMGGFGISLGDSGPINGTVFQSDDGGGPGTATDACEPLIGFPAGGIALMDRGTCNFTVKVKNAENAGAQFAIVVNNISGPPTAMGGTDNTITIPSVMISLDDGNLFKTDLPFDVLVEDGSGGAPDRDSDLDAGIIAHEYGHGISNRLTGGPATAACLGNAEQMGEGWSDWFALTLTTSPNDRPSTPRGVGTYVSFQPEDGLGIRPTQYTTDIAINPSTYASVADVVNISQPHGIGYVWNTMLWEMYWNLVDRYGYNANLYDPWNSAGNNRALQLVMDGMKFQPCRPGFVDGRDGILAADMALTGGANQCEIWRGFAKRGLGFSASQGNSNNRSDGIEAFDLPASCMTANFAGFNPPVSDAPSMNSANAGSTIPVKFSMTGTGSSLSIDSQEVSCTTLEPTGEAPIAPNSPGSTGLTQKGSKYHLNWKTDPAWAGSCRRLTIRIPAPTDAVAYFSFH